MPAEAAPTSEPEEAGLQPGRLAFPVVGIGASAGGLATLQRLFSQMPSHSGMAFVVILHLSPAHESNAASILQRVTAMPVLQVTGPVRIEADHLYIIAPTHDLSMDDGYLRVSPSARLNSGAHSAVDLFFRTLAQVHRERAVCLVLSGTGSDGAVGLTRIKEMGGITLAQLPDDAEYDAMPRAAIATGLVDIVLPVSEIPQRLMDFWQNARQIRLPTDMAASAGVQAEAEANAAQQAELALSDIMTVLRLQTRHDFRHYKRATILRRIERRLQVNSLPDLPGYRDYLKAQPDEIALLLQDLLISVTNFFRDREAFETLERDIIPGLFEGRRQEDTVRVWVAGCATGEEAYSIAMLLREQAGRTGNAPDFQVFATDIDERAIALARTGLYPGAIVTDVAPARLRQFFTREGGEYRVVKGIREKVLFAAHNVLRDPPFSRLDLVSCRNLLIYLDRRAQTGILEMFRFALKQDGTLFLGVSESADAAGNAFVPLDKKHRLFRAAASALPTRSLPTLDSPLVDAKLAATPGRDNERRPPTHAEIHRRSLEQLLPPSVLVDSRLNILHLSEGAGKFMEHAGGMPSHNLLSNVSPELRLELRTALYTASQSHGNVEVRNLRLDRGGIQRQIHLSVRPFKADDGTELALIVFDESPVTEAPSAADRSNGNAGENAARLLIGQMEGEIKQLKEHLQNTIEHSETSTEELKASNEELQAINEELRSATEELETSKEELQSMNEELTTVNFELKTKVEETSRINDDLQNLVASTDIATVFVDSGLRIKRFTPAVSGLFNLIASDIGRSLMDITHRLEYPSLSDDAQQAFVALRTIERSVRSTDGRHFLARFLPYRTADDKISGAVLTFVDVTALRAAEEKVRAGAQQL